ncbi:alginate O-acetyltransferase AlgX-related protein [Pseudomonas baltica]|uniref:AlgX/AlgJ SGNH hydrolase-like domain-containing protein n=1 Tax=Pseudomonas baltica TaxID=2762576 RepID=A0A7X1G2X2_9PSED|nr:hypothetical protein [Pseudomonas baltica]MBC2677512.1 hypothetical protein [Pseudomonas baltica]
MATLRNFVPSTAESVSELLHAWNIEEPAPSFEAPVDRSPFTISGWVLSVHEATHILIDIAGRRFSSPIDIERTDVVQALSEGYEGLHDVVKCGFSIVTDIPFSDVSSFDIAVGHEDSPSWLGTFFFEEGSKVQVGREGWLFLDNDTNNSVEQYTGDIALADQLKLDWLNYIEHFSVDADQRCSKWRFLLAPGKEYILPEYYPHTSSPQSTPNQFFEIFKANPRFIYPIAELTKHKALTYWKGDTHWTDYGAYVAFTQVVSGFNLDIEAFERHTKITYTIDHSTGDLAEKLAPPPLHPKIAFNTADSTSTVTFSNHINNNGKIVIFENSSALIHSTLVIFGSSSSDSLVKPFTLLFSRVVQVHSSASVDTSILNHECPDYVLLQSNSRFILECPQVFGTYSIKSVIADKLQRLTDLEKQRLKVKVASYQFGVSHKNNFYRALSTI